jgi:hypothetical protein
MRCIWIPGIAVVGEVQMSETNVAMPIRRRMRRGFGMLGRVIAGGHPMTANACRRALSSRS